MSILESTNSAKSWGDYVRAVEQERRCMVQTQPQPLFRVSCHERKLREFDFNPVTSQYTDQQREERYQRTRDDLNQTRSTSIQMEKANKYNIISHTGCDSLSGKTIAQRTYNSRPYHILSNLNVNEHKTIPLNADDKTIDESRPIPTANKPRKLGSHRNYNIVSNEYHSNHTQIMTDQYNQLKDHVLTKYWQTHNYDLIRGKYYDSKKEKEFRETREIQSKIHGVKQLSRLPPSVKRSEGQSYDILNCMIKDKATLREVNINDIRAVNRVQKSKEAELKVCEQEEALATISDHRKINRISFNRWQPELERGYNIITTGVKVTPTNDHSKSLTMPHVKKRQSEWERMTTSTNSISDDHSKLDILPNMSVNNSRDRESISPRGLQLVHSQRQAKDLSGSLTSSRSIPSLDLSTTDFARSVTYKEPGVNAPASQLVSIVPTPKII